MDITVLGTGSADGWPNTWCGCASCDWARRAGVIRESTSVLIDRILLIDFGPALPGQAERARVSLADVDTVLLTHAHFDHLAPQHLLTRSWTRTDKPLRVIGPPSVIRALEHWIGPHDPVSLQSVNAGDTIELDGSLTGTIVRVLPSSHFDGTDELGADAVLYDITISDGGRLFYATDTGPLPQACIEAIHDAEFDVIFMEETFGDYTDHKTGHLDLSTFPVELERLRRVNAATSTTSTIAVHLSHHNPPGDVLDDRLAQCGATTVRDGTTLSFADHALTPRSSRVLVTGGARSGKSHRAEALMSTTANVRYVATSGSRPGDAEWKQRVAIHQERRPATWQTIETLDLTDEIAKQDDRPILIDCLSLWLTGIMDRHGVWATEVCSTERQQALDLVEGDIAALVTALGQTRCHVVMVTNEVGSGIVPEHESGRLFRDLLGRLNAHVATSCDRVELVVAGRVITL